MIGWTFLSFWGIQILRRDAKGNFNSWNIIPVQHARQHITIIVYIAVL